MPTSNAYVNSRHRNQREISEDYVELIDDMIAEKGEARVVDLAHALGVSHVTVSKTIKRLIDVGLILLQLRLARALTLRTAARSRKVTRGLCVTGCHRDPSGHNDRR